MLEVVVQAETPTTDDRLAACVEEILAKPDFPAFSQQIEETLQTLNDKEVSANRLGVVVLRNYGLTLKVLQAANSFGSNRSGAPILSVAQAIFRLGIDRVRALASGMVFFEHFNAKGSHVKELVVLSLATATQADAVASRLGHPRPEQAYLCGLLRNMGEILITSYFPDEFDSIRARVARQHASLADACRATLGFTYEDLGVEMARRWSMPAEVGASMVAEPRASGEDLLVTITGLAHGLTTAMYRSDATEASSRVTLLVQKLGAPVGLSKDALEDVVKAAAEEVRRVFARLKLPSHDFAVLDKARVAKAFGRPVPAAAPRPPATVGAASVRPGPADPGLLARLEREMDPLNERSDPQAMILLVLNAIQRGGGFDRVLLALAASDGRTIGGHAAVGAGAETLKKYFSFPIGVAGGPLGITLSRQQELVLRSDWELQPQEIAQLQYLGARMVGVLPLCANGRLLGCLYYDRVESAEPPPPSVLEGLRRLRDRTIQILDGQG